MNILLVDSELKTVCDEVPKNQDVRDLIERMGIAMTHGRGIGLAANQIGETLRVIMIHTQDYQQVFINPVITKRYGGRHTGKEGCLSFPGLNALMVRDRRIVVEGFTPEWKPIKRKLKGMAARCVQHEVDHLDGKTIMEHGLYFY